MQKRTLGNSSLEVSAIGLGVLAPKGRDPLDGVRAADGLHACL